MYFIIKNATLVHSKSKKELEILPKTTLLICQTSGNILKIFSNQEPIPESYLPNIQHTIYLTKTQFIIPGLVDTHVHAPQFAFTGTGLDLPLLDWLNKYTFKCESRFSSSSFATRVYQRSALAHLKNGTTTICYFGTIHLEASKILADILKQMGMRAFVGKVCMDRNSPSYYKEKDYTQSCKDTIEFINYIKNSGDSKIVPIITPRFAPTCSRELLAGLGKIAQEYQVPIQTHLCENKEEIKWVKELFPECTSYTDVYDKYGILRKGTVLAHCVYMTDEELKRIREVQAGIAHCPNSNLSLQSGIMPARKYIDMGIKVGLGTDVAGGYSTSILDSLRQSVAVSKVASVFMENSKPLSLAEAFYLATRGGAEVLGLEDKIGWFREGMQFDSLIIDFSKLDCWTESLEKEGEMSRFEELFEKVIYLMDDRHIERIFVAGVEIYPKNFWEQ